MAPHTQDTSGSNIELRLAGGRTPDEGRVEAKTDDGKSSNIFLLLFHRSIGGIAPRRRPRVFTLTFHAAVYLI